MLGILIVRHCGRLDVCGVNNPVVLKEEVTADQSYSCIAGHSIGPTVHTTEGVCPRISKKGVLL